jgi:hypothetical protein
LIDALLTRRRGMITITKKDGTVETSFTGCVVRIDTESVQVMSDIWEMHTSALVFNNDKGEFEQHFLYSDYGPASDGEKRSATVDATDEIKALYESDLIVAKAKKALESAASAREAALRVVRTPSRGKMVKVVKGRKIPKDYVGECTWYGQATKVYGYGPRTPSMRVGMKVHGDVVYTDAKNVEVVVG